jgi:hypothetical protein
VCGKNQKLYKFAEKLKLKEFANDLHVYGYVDFIYELLNISDIVIFQMRGFNIYGNFIK